MALPTDLHSSVRELWTSWVDIANNDSHAHRALVRPILGAFFRLVALTRDASLIRSCVRLASVGFWQFDLSDYVARRQTQLLAVEYLAAAAISGDSLWERMVMVLPQHITFRQWLSMLLSKTILRLVRLDAQCAADVYHPWRRYLPDFYLYRTSPGRGVRCSFKVVRISQDVINFRGRSFAMIAASSRSMYQLPCLASGRSMVAKALHSISVSVAPPQQARRHVAWALRTAVTIFKNVYSRDPGFFNGRITHTFLSMLLRHRQFRGAAEISKLSLCLRWRCFVVLGLVRRGSTPRVAAQLCGSLSPKWLVDVVAHTRLGRRHPAAGLVRHLATRRARTPTDTRNGLKVLVRARDVGLATRAYRSALVEEHGIVPDRVTTNIVIKALLLLPTVLDVTGYVAGGDGVPFGSSEAAMRETAAVLGTGTPAAKSKLSFARHVKPLHKMFIKALYLGKDVAGARRVVGILKRVRGWRLKGLRDGERVG
ncbi:hypothetical protein V8E53_009333 [Lactarius tabidus]